MKAHTYSSKYMQSSVSILPVELQEICHRQNVPIALAKYASTDSVKLRGQFSKLSPNQMVQIESEIRSIANFYSYYYEVEFIYEGKLPVAKTYQKNLAAIKTFPALSYLYLFHGNGWLRQIALDNINDVPANSFEIAAIIHRLNDWVPQVRAAALQCCQRLFGSIQADILAQTTPYFLEKLWFSKRWGNVEKTMLKGFVFTPDVMACLAKQLQGRGVANIGFVCRLAYQQSGLDDHLEEFAFHADQPIVRSIAYQALLSKRVSWPIGLERAWIDKTSGSSKLKIVLDSRSISHDIDIGDLLEKGAADRAVAVRRVVMQELINRLEDCNYQMIALAQTMMSDKSQSVRARAEYFLNHLPNNI